MTTSVHAFPSVGDSVAIDQPTMFRAQPIADDVHVLPAWLPVPGIGVLAANSFVITADEPVLVDAGPGGLPAGEFEAALRSIIDPRELRWLWLTHTDPDHTGALEWLLAAAPELRVVTTYLGSGKLGLTPHPVPLDRTFWANPGDTVHVGDRRLVALRPPSFDAPETTGLFDPRSGVLFSADSFGAVLPRPAESAHDVDGPDLVDGLTLWSTVDSPWLHAVDRTAFDASLARVERLQPKIVASSHLPPAPDMVRRLLDLVRAVPAASPWTGPDQSALETILQQAGAGS